MPWLVLIFVFIILKFPTSALAYQPILEPSRVSTPTSSSLAKDIFAASIPVGDPTNASMAIFGKLTTKHEVDMYVFGPRSNTSIPIELTVPARKELIPFRPVLIVIAKGLNETGGGDVPFALPLSYDSLVIPSPREYDRAKVFDTFAFDQFFSGTKKTIDASARSLYFVAVWEPNGYVGPYKLIIGEKNYWSGSVSDSAPKFYINSLVFDDSVETDENESLPADWEKKQFINQKNPYQTVDSKLRLGFDILRFYIFRLGQVLAL